MSAPQRVPYISVDEYLDGEELAEERHEYVAGQVFAMAGASEAHEIIAGNVFSQIRLHLRGSGCRAFIGGMKAFIEVVQTFYYPDVLVTCEPASAKSRFKQKPVLIVEVLSPSTQAIDRREKLLNYRRLASLREYVLIEQRLRQVEIYRLAEQGVWQHELIQDGAELCLESLPRPLTLTLTDVYEDVPFS
jgi:Uma2 family endonuclease